MSILAFLTGLSSGAEQSVTAEREAARKEQEDELLYRRTNLEHMVRAAEEGRVNPEMVGRVYEEYMNSMQGLNSKPMAKGKAGFMGKRDLGQSSIFRDLGTGAVKMFGDKPGTLNIDWGAAKPTREPGMVPYKGGPGLPTEVPDMVERPGTPLEVLVNQGVQQAMPQGSGGNWLYKHPDTLKLEQEGDALRALVGQGGIKNVQTMDLLMQQYGGLPQLNEAMQNKASGTYMRALQPTLIPRGKWWDPINKIVHYGQRINDPEHPMFGQIVSIIDGMPLEGRNLVDVSSATQKVDQYGNVRFYNELGQELGPMARGAGKGFKPPATSTTADPHKVRRTLLEKVRTQVLNTANVNTRAATTPKDKRDLSLQLESVFQSMNGPAITGVSTYAALAGEITRLMPESQPQSSHTSGDALENAIGQYLADNADQLNTADTPDARAQVKADPEVMAYIKKKYRVQ